MKELRFDCDEDAILVLVEPAGPACHTGARTCFHNGDLTPAPHEALPALERTIDERRTAAPGESYTAALLAEPARIGDKVREEAEEVARAARDESDERRGRGGGRPAVPRDRAAGRAGSAPGRRLRRAQ